MHNEAIKYTSEGKRVILVGHRGHAEVNGTMGQAPMALVDDTGPGQLPSWNSDTPVAILTQTTLSVDDTARAISKIRGRFSDALVRNDLCYATTNRQEAVKKLAEQVNMVLVIGAQNSSNCNRLREVAERYGVPAYLINSADDLKEHWLTENMKVGITSGASTPEVLVDEVISKLKPDKISTLNVIEEDVTFVLPREFRE